ncbi:tetratricopeptide repeat protein [Streptacidiphilus sp. MAP5-3]|uniref:tetratricopeptide repeat protein n=1 Tax=unclassified Streptacidiphilus TaxID=2643834 RepID=UPI0035180AF0
MPDPDRAADLAEFIGLLAELRVWAGFPSYRTLAKRVGQAIRPARVVSPSTVVDAFDVGRRRLDLDLVVAIVRALGVDETGTSRWREACIRVHGSAKSGGPVGVSAQLPTDLATFTGRQEELARLLEAAMHPRDGDGTHAVVISAIEGMAGVGKTQLAVRAAHELVRAGHFADLQLHVNLRGFDPELPPADPSAVLEAFLRQLGVPAQQIPASRDERAAMYRDQVRERHALVLLDNAADENQVRDLIPASHTSLVLITSRRSLAGLDGVTPHWIDTFSEAESLDLLRRIAGHERIEAEPDEALRIVQYCDRLPLALALAAARLRSRPAWTLAELADRLQAGRLEAIRAGGRALRPVLDLSYRELTEPLQRVFRLLGCHPGPDFTPAMVAALADIPTHEAEDVLESLQDENLIRQNTPGRYHLHDLLRTFALHVQDPGSAETVEALARLFDHMRSTVAAAVDLLIPHEKHLRPAVPTAGTDVSCFVDTDQATAWLRTEHANLLAAAECAARGGFGRHATDLSALLGRYLDTNGHYQDGHVLHALALQAATDAADLAAERSAAAELGRVCVRLGQLHQARMFFEQTLEANPGHADASNAARAMSSLGVIDVGEGRHDEALRRYHEAANLFETAGDVAGQATTTGNIAVAYVRMGRFPLGIAHHERALALFRETGDRSGEARTLGNLGQLYIHTRLDDSATTHLTQALDLHLAIGDLAGASHNRIQLAHAQVRSSQFDQASEHLEQALAFFRTSGHRLGQAEALHIRGVLFTGQGHHHQAAEQLQEALASFEALAEPAHAATTLNSLGSNAFAQGQFDTALEFHRRALKRAASDGIGDQAEAHCGIGDALHANGQPELARAHWQQALDFYAYMTVCKADEVRRRLAPSHG